MDAVNHGAMEALSHALLRSAPPQSPAESEADREHTARIRVRGLVVLQLIARGYSLGYVSHLRSESLADLVASLRETLDALGAYTVRDAVRDARQRGLIV